MLSIHGLKMGGNYVHFSHIWNFIWSILEKVCPYHNSTNEDRYHKDQRQELQQIDREEVILHFTPLFSSMRSLLARILLCSALFPFCSEHFVLHPCQEVCFSVYAACHHVFNAHWQQRPTFLNCLSFPSSPSLRLLPLSYVHHLPALNTSTSTQSSTSPIINMHPDSTSSLYPGTLQITNASPSPLSPASFNATLIFVTLALVLLIILLFVFVILRAVFCFHRTPPVDSTNAITYTLPSLPSPAPLSSPESSPPQPLQSLPQCSPCLPAALLLQQSSPPDIPPPALPPKRKNLCKTLYQNTGNTTLYSITELHWHLLF